LLVVLNELHQELERNVLQRDLKLGRALRDARNNDRNGSLQQIKNLKLSKTRVFTLIQLATEVDALIQQGLLDEATLQRFDAASLRELCWSCDEVKASICEAAMEGQAITLACIKAVADEATGTTAPVLPRAVKEAVKEGIVKPTEAAKLANSLIQLPDDFSALLSLKLELAQDISDADVKEAQVSARAFIKAEQHAYALPEVKHEELQKALYQALQLDAVRLLADALEGACKVIKLARQLDIADKRLGQVLRTLEPECDATKAPHLAKLVMALRQAQMQHGGQD
jgi:hypothetical protein